MPKLEFVVEPGLSGIRVDSFLARHLRNYTRWRLHRHVCEGLVAIDGLPAEPDQRVFRTQRVSLRLVEPPDKLLLPSAGVVKIVYEDPWLLVVDKPAGLICHPVGRFQDGTLTNVLQTHLDNQTTAKGLLRAGIVHRLDRMTSGLLVVPKDHYCHTQLSLDFQNGRPFKQYLALVQGVPKFRTATLDSPIGQRPGGKSVLMSTAADSLRRRHARTDVERLADFGTAALMRCTLHTGRNHQIRVHLASEGHPVLGDEFYGTEEASFETQEADEARLEHRHALHAATLEILHPVLQQSMRFQSAPPADFWDLLPADVDAEGVKATYSGSDHKHLPERLPGHADPLA